jgi:hypothetical protein
MYGYIGVALCEPRPSLDTMWKKRDDHEEEASTYLGYLHVYILADVRAYILQTYTRPN